MNAITTVTETLFCGTVAERERLLSLGIDTCISVMKSDQHEQCDKSHPVEPGVRHFRFHFADNDEIGPDQMQDILNCFGKKTFVHCLSGQNRTTAVCLSYLVSKGMHPIEAAAQYYFYRQRTFTPDCAFPNMSCEMRKSVVEFCKMNGHA
jgi:hypothetical protein